MLPILGLLSGAALGWIRAGRGGGNRLDQAQYAFGFGVAGGILGLIVGIVLTNMFAG